MQVVKRLQINIAFSIITAFTIALMLILAFSGVNRARVQRELVAEIRSSIFERSTFRSDYLRTSNERARLQWFAKSEQIGRLLNSALDEFHDAENKKIINEMIKDNESTVKLFSDIVSNRERAKSGSVSAELSQEVENRLTTQLNLRLYDKVLQTSRLRESAAMRLLSALRLAGWSIFLVIVVVAAAAAINSWTVGRTIINRIRQLRDGASIIGQGNLDHKIEIKGHDEFVDLSNAFNAMTANLRASYINLENENTERKRAEELLRDSEGRLRLALDAADLGTWDLDTTTGIAVHSLRHDQIFGYQELQPEWSLEIALQHILPEDRPIALEAHAHAEKTGEMSFEARVRWPDGSIHWINARGRVHYDSKGGPVRVIGVVGDITERKRAEEDIKKLNEELIRNVRELEASNKELEAFVYSVAHDLRAPLRSVSGFSEILLEGYSDKVDEKGKEYLTLTIQNAEQMSKIIDDLLHLSRISRHEIHKEDVDMSRILKSLVAELHADQPGRRVVVDIKQGMIASADAGLIKVALSNLLGNAWKFTSRTAHARIECGTLDQEGKTVYYVKDNGAGFDQRFAERVFLPFHRLHTEQEFEGTGVGLAIVERVIRRHGGKIWAEGRKNEGATFFFTLR